MNSSRKSISMLIVLGLTLLVGSSTCLAQTNWSGGLHFNSGFPQGDLDDNIGSNAYGIGGHIFYSPEKSPLAIGLDLSWMNYGSETRQEPFSTTIPDVMVDVETSNNIVQSFLVLRGRMPKGPIRLYGDALLGFNYLYTETSISGVGESLEDVVSYTNQDDAAFAYGLGGGVMIPVYTSKPETEDDHPIQVLLNGGVRYIAGGEVEYLKKGSIRREGTEVSFDTITSKTDLMRMHLGVVVRF